MHYSPNMDERTPELQLPGFRFHPTEEELLQFYLKKVMFGKNLPYDIIGLLNIYHHEPWELPAYAKIGEREWYFFVPRDRKHGNGGRPNRTTQTGFWKATGSDRKIITLSEPKRIIGLKKTLVFYKGRAPRGNKTDWVMNEYRLPDHHPLPKQDVVLCKIYRKATSLKVLEQRAVMEEEEMKKIYAMTTSSPQSSMDTVLFCSKQDDFTMAMPDYQVVLKDEAIKPLEEKMDDEGGREVKTSSSLKLPSGKDQLPELKLPKLLSMDWTQDSFWTQFNSPWLQNLLTQTDILNF